MSGHGSGSSVSQAKSNGGSNARFDIAKLNEWLELFEYMQTKGVVSYIILEDDSAWTGYDHARYYRELIARFGHMPALLFNIGEEASENYSISTALSYAQQVKDIDPYDHPIGIHNVNGPNNTYINASQVDFTAIQTKGTDALAHNQRTIDWINQSKALNRRILMVGYDEPRPLMDRKGWWSTYIGGGVWEVHVNKPYDRPMSTWETAWSEIGGARVFMESIPFWEMEPDNMSVTSGTAFALVKPGEVYALYLPSGGAVTVNLTAGNTYNYSWWNPANSKNGNSQNSGTVQGGNQLFTAPGSGDWALRIVKASGSGNSAPIASNTNIAVAPGNSIDINLSYTDSDGPGSYTFTITQNPAKGTLSGSGNIRTYTANLNASGGDLFKWKVNDGLADSNEATVTVTLSTSGVNDTPIANDQSVITTEGTPVSIPLSYDDVDGPGPYTFTLIQPPTNGTAVPDQIGSNDFIYTPNGGFTGTDTFTWQVHDGLATSNVATVNISVNSILFGDSFERSNSDRVGNNWVEVESNSQVKIANGRLVFDALDDQYQPLISHAFLSQTSGVITWEFDLNFQRTGSEGTYSFWMQLGQGSLMSDNAPTDQGVAVNLKWGGPNAGLFTHEGLGYVVDGTVTQMAVVSGGDEKITVIVDHDSKSYSVSVGGQQVTGIQFENNIPIDTVRFFADGLNMNNFAFREIDNVVVRSEVDTLPDTTPPAIPTGLTVE